MLFDFGDEKSDKKERRSFELEAGVFFAMEGKSEINLSKEDLKEIEQELEGN